MTVAAREQIRAELASILGARLAEIDQEVIARTGPLLVNKKGRRPPRYQFVPSHHELRNLDGEKMGVGKVHKKSYKTMVSKSKRGRK